MTEIITSVPIVRAAALPDYVMGTMQRWLDGEPVWPYAKIMEEWGDNFEMYRRKWRRGVSEFRDRDFAAHRDLTVMMMDLRDKWIKKFGFAIPCAELFDELAKAEQVVEIGAGSGYLTGLMRLRGINVIGSDPHIGYGHVLKHGLYDHRQVIAQGKTMIRRHRDAVIFCSWPSLGETWFRQALKAMQIGQRIVMIFEESCAEATAREYLDACFDHETTIDIPAFTHLNDIALVYVKKRQRERQV
jgi:hypothetical protein